MLPCSCSEETSVQPPATSKEQLYVQYSVVFLLIIDVLMLLYLSCKLCRFFAQKPNSPFERRNKNFRGFIYIFILLALISRGVYGVISLFTLKKSPLDIAHGLLVAMDDLPIMLFVSIASAFSYSWHKLYKSFEYNSEMEAKSNNRFKTFLVTFNLLLYLIFGGLIISRLTFKWQYTCLVLHSVFAAGSLASGVMITVHGARLLHRTRQIANYTGRVLKSSNGFKATYILLIICCVLRTIKEGIAIYRSMVSKQDILKDLSQGNSSFCLIASIAYVALFYVFGEYGLFFSLILLLNFHANKAKAQFDSETDPKGSNALLIDENAYCSPFDVSGSL